MDQLLKGLKNGTTKGLSSDPKVHHFGHFGSDFLQNDWAFRTIGILGGGMHTVQDGAAHLGFLIKTSITTDVFLETYPCFQAAQTPTVGCTQRPVLWLDKSWMLYELMADAFHTNLGMFMGLSLWDWMEIIPLKNLQFCWYLSFAEPCPVLFQELKLVDLQLI